MEEDWNHKHHCHQIFEMYAEIKNFSSDLSSQDKTLR